MNVNDIVEFKKTKNRYRIAGFGRMKVPNAKGWVDSVVYENFQDFDEKLGYVGPKDVKIYTRELKDFEAKFEISVPKVQVFNSQDGKMIYDFGLPELVLARYFDEGYGLRTSVHLSEEGLKNVPMFCQTLAGDILIGGMKTADERIEQKLLDAIKKDIKAGIFEKNTVGLSEIQNLLYFLCIPDDEKKDETPVPEEKPVGVPDDETEEPLNPNEILNEITATEKPLEGIKETPVVDDQEDDDDPIDDEDEQE